MDVTCFGKTEKKLPSNCNNRKSEEPISEYDVKTEVIDFNINETSRVKAQAVDEDKNSTEFSKVEEIVLKEEGKNVDMEPEEDDDFAEIQMHLAVHNDNPVHIVVPDRAIQTIPKDILEIRPSLINGFGIYALVNIPKGVQLGPYEGKLSKTESTAGCSWKLQEGRLLDEGDETSSNYLRYINCTKCLSEQNLEAFQQSGNIYYRTSRDVEKNEELLIYFNNTPDSFYYNPPVENTVEEIYTCQFCHVDLKVDSDWDEHLRLCRFGTLGIGMNDEEMSQYNDMEESSEDMSLLRVKDFTCDICDFATKHEGHFKRHKVAKHGQTNHELSFTQPQRTRTERKELFKCPDCVYETYTESYLIRHQNARHERKDVVKCNVCDYETYDKLSLDRHYSAAHEQKNPLKCPVCNLETYSKSSLQRHMTVKHERNNLFKCAECDYETHAKRYLTYHQNVAHERKTLYKCADCKYESYQKYSFYLHRLKHDRKNILTCQHCSFETYDISTFNRHQRVKHEQKNVLKCTECKFETFYRYSMNVHMSKHKGENIKCADCDFETFYKSCMNRHRSVQHEKKNVYKCTNCLYESFNKYSLNRHRKLVHERYGQQS